MDFQTAFLAFGLCLAALAVVTTFIGMRKENFPSRKALIGLLLLAVFLVAGTTTFAVKLAVEEQQQRAEGDAHPTGEEASVPPVVVPARF